MVEFQALAARTPYGLPRRTAVGFDYNRVNMLLALSLIHICYSLLAHRLQENGEVW